MCAVLFMDAVICVYMGALCKLWVRALFVSVGQRMKDGI